MTRIERKHAIAKMAADFLISHGYRVFVYEKDNNCFTWFHYGDADNVAYMQIDELTDEIMISTEHRPNKSCGTGFRVGPTQWNNINGYKMGFVNVPAGFSGTFDVRKYKGIEDKVNRENILKYVEYKG